MSSGDKPTIKAEYHAGHLYYCFKDLKVATYFKPPHDPSFSRRGATYFCNDKSYMRKSSQGMYLRGLALFNYLKHSECIIHDLVLQQLSEDFTLSEIMKHYFNIRYLNSPTTANTPTVNNANHIEMESSRSCSNLNDVYKSSIKKDLIQMRKSYQDAFDIEQFLAGPVFQECEGEINMYEHFRVVSADNNDIFAVKSPNRGWGKKPIHKFKLSTAKERTRQVLTGFQKLCDISGQKFQWYLRVWFKTRPQDFLYFVKYYLRSGPKAVKLLCDEIKKKKGQHIISGVPKAEFMAYIKDRLNVSTHMMTEIRLWPELDDILPNRAEIDKVIDQYNIRAWNVMQTEYAYHGFCSTVESLVQYLIQSHIKEQKQKELLGLPFVASLNDTILFKLAMDSRKTNRSSSVVLSVVPINLSTFNPQSRDSFFPIAMWYGKESGVQSFIEKIRKDIVHVQQKVHSHNGFDHRYKFTWTSDLAALQHVCPGLRTNNMFCPYCACKRDQVFNLKTSEARQVENKLCIGENIICVMHLIERVSEYLLLRSAEHDPDRLINTRLRTLPNFSTFQIVENTKETHPDECIRSELYLSGRQCTTLLNNYSMVLESCPEDVLNIWKTWKDVVHIIVKDYKSLDSMDQSLKRKKHIYDKQVAKNPAKATNDIHYSGIVDRLTCLINNFAISVVDRFIGTGRTSHYIHILHAHVPHLLSKLMDRHQSLILYSNQGFESSHGYDSFIEERHCARAACRDHNQTDNFFDGILGSRKNISDQDWNVWLQGYELLQLMLYKHRVLIMSAEVENATWNRMLRKVKKAHKAMVAVANVEASFNFEYDFSYEDSIHLDVLYQSDEEDEDVEEDEDDHEDVDPDQQDSTRQISDVTVVHYADNTGPTTMSLLMLDTPQSTTHTLVTPTAPVQIEICSQLDNILGMSVHENRIVYAENVDQTPNVTGLYPFDWTMNSGFGVPAQYLQYQQYQQYLHYLHYQQQYQQYQQYQQNEPASSSDEYVTVPAAISPIPFSTSSQSNSQYPDIQNNSQRKVPQKSIISGAQKRVLDISETSSPKRSRSEINSSELVKLGSLDDIKLQMSVVHNTEDMNENVSMFLGRVQDKFSTILDHQTGRNLIRGLNIASSGITDHRLDVVKGVAACEVTKRLGWICADMILVYLTLTCHRYNTEARVLNPEVMIDLDNSQGGIPNSLVGLDNTSIILYPFLTSGHWTLGVYLPKNLVVLYFDSYGHVPLYYEQFIDNHRKLVLHPLCPSVFKKDYVFFNVTSGLQLQKDGSSCGMFVMVFAELLLMGYKPYEIRSVKWFSSDKMVKVVRVLMANRLRSYR